MVRIVLTFFVILCSFVTPVFSEETTVSATEKAYVLVAVDAKGENTITKFEMIDGVMTPKYYRVDLAKTEYGDKENHNESDNKYYKWGKDSNGNNTLVEGTIDDHNITYYVNNTDPSLDRIDTGQAGADIVGNFTNQSVISSFVGSNYRVTAYGGAINNNDGKIGDITGNFVGNYASAIAPSSAYGDASAYGGAINNGGGTIGDITGDFVGNYVSAIASSPRRYGSYSGANGGAIYNNGTIGDITGDFVGNYASASFFPTNIDPDYTSGDSVGEAYGGAIFNGGGTIGDIKGNFIGNYASASSIGASASAYGGAINSWGRGTIGDITGNFIGNYASASYSDIRYVIQAIANGGAIHNNGTIGDITGDFIGNYASAIVSSSVYGQGGAEAYGGAINNEGGKIGNITGDFVGNYASASVGGAVAYGGAIYNIYNIYNNNDGTIGDITGNFVGNYASAIAPSSSDVYGDLSTDAYGGAIYNYGGATIGDITGNFIGNYASASSSDGYASAYGGAIYTDRGIVGNITGDFIGNYASASSSGGGATALGGAIYNNWLLTNEDLARTGNFIGNYASASSSGATALASGGAIYHYQAIIGDIKGNFIGNYASASSSGGDATALGGAIYNQNTPIGSKDSAGRRVGGIINSNFINNYAKAESTDANAKALGGAIWTSSGFSVIADNGSSVFSGNKTITTINKGSSNETTTETQNAIWVNNKTVLTLKSVNNGTIRFDDKIDGVVGYGLNLTGDSTGKILLNNNMDNAKVTMDTVTLNLGKNDVFKTSDVTVNSGTLGFINGIAEAQSMQSLNINGNTNLALDVNLAAKTMDTLPENAVIAQDAKIGVNYLNLLNDATSDKTNIFFAPEDYANQVSYTGASPIAYSPIWKYEVSYNPDDGLFTFLRGGSSTGNSSDNYNPSVLAPAVATQAGAYTTQLQTFNYAFQHSDTFMTIPAVERIAIRDRNKYALSPTGDAGDVGNFSPLFMKDESAGFWVKPYASFESIPLKNGPKVSNINYGTLVGYDTALKSTKFGFDRVITGYVGYNGASQRYSGVDTYQNGGILGTTFTFYKNNFFNATTVSVGASAGNSNNMYGSENYTMLLGGIGNKSGYNFEFKEGKFIIQPSMLISYTFVNTFDYRNAAGLSIKSDPLNAIQLAPGIKFIANTKNGWQPYVGISMVWNVLDNSKVMANDVRLPEMSIRPYVQYGIGAQKRFGERLTGYLQAMMHNGGRNGISLSGGMRWRI